MKKSLVLSMAFMVSLIGLLTLNSCRKDTGNNNNVNTTSDTLSGVINQNRTLTAGKTYYLNGIVFVKSGATLKVEPGVIVKALAGTKAVLVITRGAKIDCQGTATNPIVFTSNRPAGQRSVGDWGGIVLTGRAKVNSSFNGVAGRRVVEGFDAAEAAAYGEDIVGGGDDDNDNSGIIKYTRIEFCGIPLSSQANSELNGLSCIAVGRGTTLEYIQISYSGDDSFEWWGGTVNAKHLIAYRGVDDDFDTDNGYSGKVQFGLSIRDNAIYDVGAASSNGFETDNDETGSTAQPQTSPVFSNMTFIGPGAFVGNSNIHPNFGRAAHIRRSSKLNVFNSVFMGWANGINIDGANTNTYVANGDIEIKNNIIAGFPAGRYIYASGASGATPAVHLMVSAHANDTSISNLSNLMLANLTAANTDPRPLAGSPLLNKASFSSAKLNGLTQTTYVGAFAVGDTWMQGWTEWNPQTRNY